MKTLSNQSIICPHCGQTIRVTLDTSNGSQDFYDDCPACCHSIHLNMYVNEQHDCIDLSIDADDEQIF